MLSRRLTITLEHIASGSPPVPLAGIAIDQSLARHVQERLGVVGLLDPPADGIFGPVSLWAIGEFLKNAGEEDGGR